MAEQNQEPFNSDRSMFFQDAAIESRGEDILGREPFAQLVADQLSSSPGGMVFGLTGSWGSGKTSAVNMVAEMLNEGPDSDTDTDAPASGVSEEETNNRPVILRFDPGIFSGTEQLVEHFFEELGAQFIETEDTRLQTVGKLMSSYGPMLGSLRFLPMVGNVLGGLGELTTHAGNRMQGDSEPPPSINKKRKDLRQALADQPRPVIVIIDDLDRLRSEEIRDMVQLVRLNADFPKTTYLLCYDRERVERALGATDMFSVDTESPESPTPSTDQRALEEGRAYLEKIVQLTYEVPHLRDSDLTKLLAEGLIERLGAAGQRAGSSDEELTIDEERLSGILHLVIRPFLSSMRDVKRYLNILPAALEQTYGEVALEDTAALEAMRLQLPSLYNRLPRVSQALTQLPTPIQFASSSGNREVEEEYKAKVQEFVGGAGEHDREILEHLVSQLFPAAARHLRGSIGVALEPEKWRRERRVADQEVLSTYFLKQLPSDGIPTPEVIEIIGAADDRERLNGILDGKEPERLETLIGRVRDYAEVLEDSQICPLIEAFLNNLSRMRTESKSLVDRSPEHRILGLARDLLLQISEEDERGRIVEEVLSNVSNLGAKVELVDMVGRSPDSGEGLVSEQKNRRLDELVLSQLERTSPEELAAERKPAQVLGGALRLDNLLGPEAFRGKALAEQYLEDDSVLLAVLEECVGHEYVLGRGSLDSRRPTFHPERLTTFIGELRAAERVGQIAERLDNSCDEFQLDPQSGRAHALVMAVEHFGVRPRSSEDGEYSRE